jgi:hypothetical protein
MRSHFAFVAVVVSLVGCGSDAPPPVDAAADDAAVTPDAPSVCTTMPAIPTGDPNGHPSPLSVGAGEARAGRLTTADLPTDRTGLATWHAGDFVLANEHVAAIVEDAGPSDLFDPFGGKLVGLGLMQGGRIVSAADFEEIIPGLGLYTLEPESVTVIADGSDGGEAIVRSVGTMTLIPFLADFAGHLFGSYDSLRVAIDHVLAPGSHAIEIRFQVAPDRPGRLHVSHPVQVIVQSSRMPAFVDPVGFDTGAAATATRILFEDEVGPSYAWESADGPIARTIEAGGAGIYTAMPFDAEGCAITEHVYGRVTIGAAPGLSPLRRVLADRDGTTLHAVDVHVTESDGRDAANVHVVAESIDGSVLVRMRTDATGHATLDLPAAAATLSATREGQLLVTGQVLGATDASATIRLPAYATIHVVTQDEAGAPLPSRIQVIPDVAPAAPPPSLGERVEIAGRLHLVFEPTGEATLRVPPGSHRLVVSRGYEYEIHDQHVTVAAGDTAEVAAMLVRSIDTTDHLSADLHIHTNRSPDAPDSGARKVAGAAAEGLEVPLRSDHEWVNDFEPDIHALGLDPFVFGVCSLELTTFAWGHFGVFPLDQTSAMPNGGSVDWAFRRPADVFADARSRTTTAGSAALVVNHPRQGGPAGAIFAYFDEMGFDRTTLTAVDARWDDSFGVIEVFNDSGFDFNESTSVADWFAFLNAGRDMFAVGSSDSHGITDSPVGYPRTWARVGTDDPDALRAMGPGPLRDAVVAGHTTIGGGIYVTADIGGHGPGDHVTGAGATESMHVVVQAPTWVDVDRLRVFVNGVVTTDATLTPGDPIVRFDDVIDVDVAATGRTWVVVAVTADTELEPVHPGRMPFAVTNPIFLSR